MEKRCLTYSRQDEVRDRHRSGKSQALSLLPDLDNVLKGK